MRKDVLGRTALAIAGAAALAGGAAGIATAQPVPGVVQINDSTAWTVSATATGATFTLEPPSMNRCMTFLYKGTSANAQAYLDWVSQNPDATTEEITAKATEMGIEIVDPMDYTETSFVYKYPILATADDLKADPDYNWETILAAWGSLVDKGYVSVGDHTATLDLDPGNYLVTAACYENEKVELDPGSGRYAFNEIDGSQRLHVKEFIVGQTQPEPEPEPEAPGPFEGLFGSLDG